jgi:alkanesulfonate monooxygenase SsuD/methylene tetrahydromethanopterin reductase-like flavin-dependent oxidoreductase (luciferase family)
MNSIPQVRAPVVESFVRMQDLGSEPAEKHRGRGSAGGRVIGAPEFGISVTPVWANQADIERIVGIADEAGLDLVGIQDHPYQWRFLDTWTLISYLAARTSRVRFFPDVANLPLRPPAVLAKAVASLDVLTGGRVELGRGPGGSGTRSRPWAAHGGLRGRRSRRPRRPST